ncbi:MAG: polysaccharide deacetylase family protein [Dehalococcoidia bacterium]|nr:polysaccharide deacetylase family protein [Dehalococcoidia bacterium]
MRWLVLAPLLALALGAAACRDDAASSTPTPTATADASATAAPTDEPSTPLPTSTATPATPTATPTAPPTSVPTTAPTAAPTSAPTAEPTAQPTIEPAAATVIDRGPTGRRVVTLTFDAGSDVGFASEILDTLAAEGIRAGFGMTGRWAEENPELVRRMAAEGHGFVNHSYSHDSFTGLSTGAGPMSREERWQELDRTEAVLQQLTGRTTKPYFRPPYGDYDASVNVDVGARGYAYNVMWTVDSRGWNALPAADIVARCLERAEPGAVYIFHVGSASQDAAALPAIIQGLRAQGYGFVTLAELLGG